MSSKYLKMAAAVIFVIGVVAGNNWAKDANKPASSKIDKKTDKSAVSSNKEKETEKSAASSKTDKKTDKSANTSKTDKKTEKPAASSKSKSSPKSYNGTVKVIKNKDGKVESIDLTVGSILKTTYHITLDETGKELAAKLSDKKVEATGTVEKKKGGKWLTLSKYNEKKPKAKKETKKSSTEPNKTADTKPKKNANTEKTKDTDKK